MNYNVAKINMHCFGEKRIKLGGMGGGGRERVCVCVCVCVCV